MSGFGWRAHLADDWPRAGHRLLLANVRGDGRTDVLTVGFPVWTSIEEGVALPEDAGIMLPQGAWEAIAALVQPTSHERELRLMESVLLYERERVDSVLNAAVSSLSTEDT